MRMNLSTMTEDFMISYETLVAGFCPTNGWLKTDRYYSKVTLKIKSVPFKDKLFPLIMMQK